MPQPDAYTPQHNYTDWSTSFPDQPHSGAYLDSDFNEIADIIAQHKARLALIQRDDGQIANLSIGLDQLKPEIVLGTPTDWVTATDYEVKNVVWHNDILYVCNTDHTSGVFATDLAAVKWTAYLDYADPLGDAQDAATAAETAQAAAEDAQDLAETAQAAAEAAQAAAEVAQAAAEAAFDTLVFPIAVADGGSGATTAAQARTNWGIGTLDSPQFAALNIGHATSHTIDLSGGRLRIEGSNIALASDIGVTLQGYDVDTFFKDVGGTISAATIFSAAATFNAGAVFSRAVDTDLASWGNTTTTHTLAPRWASSGTLWELTPAPSGTPDATKGFGYDVTNARWFCDTPMRFPAGSVSVPALQINGTNGFYESSGGVWTYASSGAARWSAGSNIDTLVPIVTAAGAASAPAWAHRTNTDTGLYFVSTTSIGLSIDNSLKWDIDASRMLMASGMDIVLNSALAPSSAYSVGFRRVPAASITTGTLVAADSGKRVQATGAVTAPASVFSEGDTIVIYAGSSSRTITQGAGLTLIWEGAGTTGSRTLAAYGHCTIIYNSATEAVITGSLT